MCLHVENFRKSMILVKRERGKCFYVSLLLRSILCKSRAKWKKNKLNK